MKGSYADEVGVSVLRLEVCFVKRIVLYGARWLDIVEPLGRSNEVNTARYAELLRPLMQVNGGIIWRSATSSFH